MEVKANINAKKRILAMINNEEKVIRYLCVLCAENSPLYKEELK